MAVSTSETSDLSRLLSVLLEQGPGEFIRVDSFTRCGRGVAVVRLSVIPAAGEGNYERF